MSILLTSNFATAGDIACRMLQKGAEGEVLGVFSQGIYAKMGEEILLFHDAKWGSVPFGIAIPHFAEYAEESGAALGDTVALSESAVTFGEKTMPLRYVFAEKAAPAKLVRPAAKRIADVEQYVLENGSAGGMLDLLDRDRGGARASVAALMQGDANAAVKLIGLGRGLTPSGDDFLCGFFALLAAAGDTRFDHVREAVLDRLDRTTSISAAYLEAALTGGYFTVYDRAVRALMTEEPFESNCDFVLSLGASSGTDTMLGALAAAKIVG